MISFCLLGYYYYFEASPGVQGDAGRIMTGLLDLQSGGKLEFYYHMYGSGIGTLNVYTMDTNSVLVKIWTQSGPQGNSWYKTEVSIPFGQYRIVFEGIRGSSHRGDIAIDEMRVKPANYLSFSNGPGKFEWTRKNGSTPSSNTVPSHDANGSKKGGLYFIETSKPRFEGDSARIMTDLLDVQFSNRELEFHYNMYGDSIGTLNVYTMDSNSVLDKIWTQSGSQGQSWLKTNVPIPIGQYRIVFEGIRGSDFTGNIAIDEIGVTYDNIRNVGAWVNVTLSRPYWIKEIGMIQNRESLLTQARQVRIDISDGSTTKMDMYDLKPDDQHNWEAVRFDPPVLANWVKITFTKAYLDTLESFGIVELDIIADFGSLANQAALTGTATSSSETDSNHGAQYAIDGTLTNNLSFLADTSDGQWVLITLDSEYWVHVLKYANRCEMNSQHRSVLIQIYDSTPSLLWENSVSSQVLAFNDANECKSFRWTTIPLQQTRLVNSVKFTIKAMWSVEGSSVATGMGEIQIFTGRNLISSSAPTVDDIFPNEKRPLIRTLTDMDRTVCSFEVQDISGEKLLFHANAVGVLQFQLVITTNGGAAGDFDVYSAGNATAEITSARMQRCTGPEYPGTGEFVWSCTCAIDEEECSLYAAMILISTSSVYQICEIELLAGPASHE